MLFFFFSNVNIQFDVRKLIWRFYTITKVLPTTSLVKFISKIKFAKVALNKNIEIFVIHFATLKAMPIHHSRDFKFSDDIILAAL